MKRSSRKNRKDAGIARKGMGNGHQQSTVNTEKVKGAQEPEVTLKQHVKGSDLSLSGYSKEFKNGEYPFMPIEDYRSLYRREVTTLWQEVEDFKTICQNEIARQKALLDKCIANTEMYIQGTKENGSAPEVTEDKYYAKDLQQLDTDMVTIERNQKLLDEEQTLDAREENLLKRQEKLKQYEKDVEEAELLLDKRQSIVRRRSEVVENLNEDLLSMKQELQANIEEAETELINNDAVEDHTDDSSDVSTTTTTTPTATNCNTPETSSKARRHWQLARRHLVDKVTVLETTVSRYRAQVASSAAMITAKDITIARLQKQNEELLNAIESKEKKIKQIESRLSLTIEDKARSDKKLEMMLEELQNIDLSSTAKTFTSTEKTSSKVPPNKRMLKKQISTFSFFTKSEQNSVKSGSNVRLERRTSSAKSLASDNHAGEENRNRDDNGQTIYKGRSSSDTDLELGADDISSKACCVM
ncbi:hypothetical protein ACF0H5_003470 [Mactra antiquata]